MKVRHQVCTRLCPSRNKRHPCQPICYWSSMECIIDQCKLLQFLFPGRTWVPRAFATFNCKNIVTAIHKSLLYTEKRNCGKPTKPSRFVAFKDAHQDRLLQNNLTYCIAHSSLFSDLHTCKQGNAPQPLRSWNLFPRLLTVLSRSPFTRCDNVLLR